MERVGPERRHNHDRTVGPCNRIGHVGKPDNPRESSCELFNFSIVTRTMAIVRTWPRGRNLLAGETLPLVCLQMISPSYDYVIKMFGLRDRNDVGVHNS